LGDHLKFNCLPSWEKGLWLTLKGGFVAKSPNLCPYDNNKKKVEEEYKRGEN
jgi:hypothetical protein